MSWSVHAIADKPNKLKKAEQKAKTKGVMLTASFMRKLNAEDRHQSKETSAVTEFDEQIRKARNAVKSALDRRPKLTDQECKDANRRKAVESLFQQATQLHQSFQSERLPEAAE